MYCHQFHTIRPIRITDSSLYNYDIQQFSIIPVYVHTHVHTSTSGSFARIYKGLFAFLGTIALAVHWNELDRDGMARHLLVPPIGWSTSNRNSVFPFIGPRKTDRILLNIISSVIIDVNRILPIRPFLAKSMRDFGILIADPSAWDIGRQIMSRS